MGDMIPISYLFGLFSRHKALTRLRGIIGNRYHVPDLT